MKCPRCSFMEDKVIDSRASKEGSAVRRRRECLSCACRYTTIEEIIPSELFIIKRDGRREEFDPQKIRTGLEKACYKRPIKDEQLDVVMATLRAAVEALGEREIPSRTLGEMVMQELVQLDQVAYVRFASVYHEFADAEAFIKQVRELKKKAK